MAQLDGVLHLRHGQQGRHPQGGERQPLAGGEQGHGVERVVGGQERDVVGEALPPLQGVLVALEGHAQVVEGARHRDGGLEALVPVLDHGGQVVDEHVAHLVDTGPLPRAPCDVVRPGFEALTGVDDDQAPGHEAGDDALHGQIAGGEVEDAGAVERHLVIDTALSGQTPGLAQDRGHAPVVDLGEHGDEPGHVRALAGGGGEGVLDLVDAEQCGQAGQVAQPLLEGFGGGVLGGLVAAAVDTALFGDVAQNAAGQAQGRALAGLRGAPQDQPVQVEAHVGEGERQLGVARQERGEHGQAPGHGELPRGLRGLVPHPGGEGVDERVVDGLLLGVEELHSRPVQAVGVGVEHGGQTVDERFG